MGAPSEGHRVGRYVLFDEVAAGGMAKVYLGRLVGDRGFARTVAIKRPHEQFAQDQEFRAMLIDEARIASRIQHSNVVSTLDVVEDENELLLVMEYVHGESLARLARAARAKGGIPLNALMTILAQALYGLDAAHEATDDLGNPLNVVHRDVSPQNILVGVDGVTRVLDFGVAKAIGRLSNTSTGVLKGKLSYMAPEQILGHPIDRRADVYAAAVILWEILVGRPLFRGENEAATMRMVLDYEVPRPGELTEGIPAVLDQLVMRGLARNPQDRFPTAREFGDGLLRVGFATASEIGRLVRELGGNALGDRARRVAEIESKSGIHVPPNLVPPNLVAANLVPPTAAAATARTDEVTLALPAPKGDRRVLIAAAAILGLGVAGLVLALAMGGEKSERAAAKGDPTDESAASATATKPKPKPAAPTESSTSSTPAPETSATTSATPAPEPSAAPKPSQSTAPTGKKPYRPNCNPPYTTDQDGIRTPKMECL